MRNDGSMDHHCGVVLLAAQVGNWSGNGVCVCLWFAQYSAGRRGSRFLEPLIIQGVGSKISDGEGHRFFRQINRTTDPAPTPLIQLLFFPHPL